ncbi:PIG-L deacetylase family protein [Alicyclobacillus fastidiosus]|uniref:PIG-L family deacetylase n=1 Tax=Alicyclobacillus fastidiosus TaxID=392011 RepID=A0ABV5ACV5_9BACL|nr:PIG-L family deacetylase [Alicyclobacillus fastidiosus]WEH11288.1 PIG-L family deacetylase [Alicyclobacillus fastidiosus]
MTITGKKILLFVAHPDDEAYCSGTIAKLSAANNHITMVIATEGNRGTQNPEVKPEQLAAQRKVEMGKAAEILGIHELVWLGYEDGGLWNAPDYKERAFKVIRSHRPDVVITFDPWKKYDFHSDHQTTGFVVTEAAYLGRCVWYFPEHMEEGLTGHAPAEVYLFQPEEANYTVDVTDFLKTKLDAAVVHASQASDAGMNHLMRMQRLLSDAANGNLSQIGDVKQALKDVAQLDAESTERLRKVYESDLYI